MDTLKQVADAVGRVVDGAGVVVIAAGLLLACIRFVPAALRARAGAPVPPRSPADAAAAGLPATDVYRQLRQDLGRAILLGLEYLVAGDIIHTVAVAPSLQNVVILGLIVLIRTFLSMALEVELEGRWPWQRAAARGATAP